MFIKSIRIKEGLFIREEDFSPNFNLIHSKSNSCGKTTLIRFILYSLGFNIPSTRHINFEQCDVSTIVEMDSGEVLKFERTSAHCLSVESEKSKDIFVLPSQQYDIHSKIFNTQNEDVLRNILGCIYADQEKGWTLLNRGIAIGSVHFNIEELLRGLTGRSCKDLINELEKTQRELNRYRQIASIAQYQNEVSENSGSIVHDSYENTSNAEIEALLIQKKYLKKEILRVDSALKDNQKFKKYIADMKLRIRLTTGEIITVSEDNIVGLADTLQFLITKKNLLASELAHVQGLIDRQENQQEVENEQLSFLSSESLADAFDKRIATVPIDSIAVGKKIRKLEQHLKELKQAISDKTRANNSAADSMYKVMLKYASELGLGNDSNFNPSYLFTSNLKELSGATLHKTVFAFRLAYIVEVQKTTGIKLPLILDSPRGKEVDDKNIKLMTNILKRDFSDNQIIIASIFEYDFEKIHRIEIADRLVNTPIKQEQ